MIDYLNQLDTQLLLLLNGQGNPFWDNVMWRISAMMTWGFSVVVLLYILYRKGGWREALFAVIAIAVVIALCDQISSSFFKPFFQRLRPTRNPDIAPFLNIVNDYRGGRYGFISSHAANSFGFAVFSALLFRRRFYTVVALVWAGVNSYSRIYLGVHFPGDVLAGMMVGVAVGIMVYMLYEMIHLRYWKNLKLSSGIDCYQGVMPWLMVAALGLTFILIFFWSAASLICS